MRSLFTLIFTVLSILAPARAATKTSVEQLDKLLAELYTQGKSDDAIADRLKEIDLTEQLTPSVMNSFVQYQPGPLAIVQIRVLALESALLAPPPKDLPTAPAPDHATQKAMLSRAIDYDTKQYAQLPRLTADKVTTRYQNGEDYVRTGTGAGSHMAHSDLGLTPTNPYLRMLGQHTTAVSSENGIELPPAKVKNADPAAQNGQISQGGAGLVLGVILMDAGRGQISWLRWETIDGKQIAIYSFSVDRKQSHYRVNYCCFPQSENVGSHIGVSPAGASSGGKPPTSANYGTATSFVPFKTSPGYHGELFIDPDTGTIVRLITQADLKPTDLVRQEDIRVDYGPVELAGKQYIVPLQSMVLTEVIPSADSYSKFSTRRTLFDIQYTEYRLGTTASDGN